jgi:hypothetical protein
MAETRVEVYRSATDQRLGEADAVSDGWAVIQRELLPDGTSRVTYRHASADGRAQPTEQPGGGDGVAGPWARPVLEPVVAWVIVVTAGGLTAVAGTALPWLSVTSGQLSVNRSGLDVGGGAAIVIAAIAGATALVGLLSFASPSGRWWFPVLVGALAVIVIGAIEYQEMQDRVDSVRSDDAVKASVGLGIWAVLGGGIFAAVGAIGMRARTTESSG